MGVGLGSVVAIMRQHGEVRVRVRVGWGKGRVRVMRQHGE